MTKAAWALLLSPTVVGVGEVEVGGGGGGGGLAVGGGRAPLGGA